LHDGTYFLLERHIQRLLASAAYFNFRTRHDTVAQALEAYAHGLRDGDWRIRLLVSQKGGVRIEYRPLQSLPATPLPVALSWAPVAEQSAFLLHKTTQRAIHDSYRGCRTDIFDVLLWNDHGELTEFTTGNLVVELDGQRWTPPSVCGLLAGTFRAELLDQGRIRERILPCSILQHASRIWLVNSVRTWVEVSLIDTTSRPNPLTKEF
jgi:para-aminobenzoate synthetase/4-amino-4-deoxychorismate lyase